MTFQGKALAKAETQQCLPQRHVQQIMLKKAHEGFELARHVRCSQGLIEIKTDMQNSQLRSAICDSQLQNATRV